MPQAANRRLVPNEHTLALLGDDEPLGAQVLERLPNGALSHLELVDQRRLAGEAITGRESTSFDVSAEVIADLLVDRPIARRVDARIARPPTLR